MEISNKAVVNHQHRLNPHFPTCAPGAPDKFNPFKPYLKTIQILAESWGPKNAKIYNDPSVFVFLSMSVCLCLY